MPNDSDSPIPTSITLETIEQARDRIAPYIHWTPVFTSATLSGLTGTRLHLKAENLQKTGAFKAHGAVNAVAQLTPEQRAAGVGTEEQMLAPTGDLDDGLAGEVGGREGGDTKVGVRQGAAGERAMQPARGQPDSVTLGHVLIVVPRPGGMMGI